MDFRNFTFKGQTYPVAFELFGPTMARSETGQIEPRFSRTNIFEIGVCALTLLDQLAPEQPTPNRLFSNGVAVWEITDSNILADFEWALRSQNIELYELLIIRVYARISNNELICRVRFSSGPPRDQALNQVLLARHDPATPGL